MNLDRITALFAALALVGAVALACSDPSPRVAPPAGCPTSTVCADLARSLDPTALDLAGCGR